MIDKEVKRLIEKEERRQQEKVILVASENMASDDVRKAEMSVLMNKYAEGYPGARYYGGCENVDKIELLAQKRGRELFGLSSKKWHVNVQPYSGSPANIEVYFALVPIGGKIMGLELSHGGHLTHGHRVSASGILWKQKPYLVDKKTERLDYDALRKEAIKAEPKLIVAGFTAYPRKIDFKKFREIADACGAYLMVDMSHFAGLVAGGMHPSPFPYAHIVTTTTHKTLRGPRAALIFSKGEEIAERVNKAVFPGLQGGPHMHTIAAVAVALGEAQKPSFQKYARQVVENAQALAEELKKRGWRVITGGTDNHIVLVDVWMNGKGIGGKEAEERLEHAGIYANRNTIPFDTRKPRDPSGMRFGTPFETTKMIRAGMSQQQMKRRFVQIAEKIDNALRK